MLWGHPDGVTPSHVLRKERHQGQTIITSSVYWLSIRLWIYDGDTDFIHLLALSKILFYSFMEKPLIFK